MRQGEVRILGLEIIVEKDVDVDQPWPPADAVGPAQIPFQTLDGRQEFGRRELRLRKRAEIGEILLRRVAPGSGAPERRARRDASDTTQRDLLEGAPDICGAAADIAAEAEADRHQSAFIARWRSHREP